MKLYAVFGNPIAHSKSPYLHNFTFEKLGIDARYVRYKLEDVSKFRDLFFELGLSGANITVPFKEILFESCDEVVGIAQKIGAINTIVRRDGKLFGYNTDALGFYRNIEHDNVKTALIIGAGGSARAIAMILQECGINVSVINRSEKRLEFFRKNGFKCAEFEVFCEIFERESITNSVGNSKYDLIINATSSSINNELPLDSTILVELFDGAKIVFDLMYDKKCPFLELAKKYNGRNCNTKKHKIRVVDGANMLLYQAISASSIFLNKSYKIIEKAMSSAWR